MALTYNKRQELEGGLYYFSRLELLATQEEKYYLEWHRRKFWIPKHDVVELIHVVPYNHPDDDWPKMPYYKLITTQETARNMIEDLVYRYPTQRKSRKAQPSPTTTSRPQKHENSISEKEKERLRRFWSQS